MATDSSYVTGDPRIDALLYPSSYWLNANLLPGTPVTASYSFLQAVPDDDAMGLLDFRPFTQRQRDEVAAILDDLASQTGLCFEYVPEGGLLRFGLYGDIAGLPAGVPNDGMAVYRFQLDDPGADIWLNHTTPGVSNLESGYGRFLLLHELGHGLGLKHPGNYSEFDQGPFMPAELSPGENTVMAYHGRQHQHFQAYDQLALRHIYGDAGAQAPEVHTFRVAGNEGYLVGSHFDDLFVIETARLVDGWLFVESGRGNDRFEVSLSDRPVELWLSLSGGRDLDQLQLDVPRDAVRLDLRGEGEAGLALIGPEGGFIQLVDIERIDFTDQSRALDVDGGAGEAFRIYNAAFAREPDAEGLGYWIAQRDAGMAVSEMAARFIDSDEFQALYADGLEASGFVTMLYANVLGREPDADGLAYWVAELEAQRMESAELLARFSDSAENRVQTAGLVSQGIEFEAWLG